MEQFKKDYIKNVADHISLFGFSEEVAIFIGCQFALESDFGRSLLATTSHNHCGMKFPLVRPTLAYKIEGLSFAGFNSFEFCLVDYVLCLTYRKPMRKEMEDLNLFKHFIKDWYCPHKTYLQRITNLFNSYKNVSKN